MTPMPDRCGSSQTLKYSMPVSRIWFTRFLTVPTLTPSALDISL